MIANEPVGSVQDYIDFWNDWLIDKAWPLWLEYGVDWRRGAFHESLEANSLICAVGFRRLRVVARQTYVFSQAALRNVPSAEHAVDLGIAFLLGPARLQGGGFAWRFNLENQAIDTTLDLYDHAFVLNAFASAASIIGRDLLYREAINLLTFLETHFRHSEGGYKECIPASLPRRQNPHMHLLEACLAAFETFQDLRFLDSAGELIDLFLERLFQPAVGAIPEFFDDHFHPVFQSGRFAVEPGHHYEWIWLLTRYQGKLHQAGRGRRLDIAKAIDSLSAFVDCHGIDPKTGLVRDVVWSDGHVASDQFRLWPQTERLKREIRRGSDATQLQLKSFQVLSQHFSQAKVGLWHERLDHDGEPLRGQPVPASSLYHICCAFADVTEVQMARKIE